MRIHAGLLVLVLAACGDDSSGAPSVNISEELPGATCPNGGVRVEVSSDGSTTTVHACDGADGTTVTVTAEPAGAHCEHGGVLLTTADGSTYLCNGGAGGIGSVTVTPEPAGEHCAAGGVLLDAGAGGSSYVCNGAPGLSVVVTQELAGATCPAGGFRLDSPSGTSFVCHGVDGADGVAGQSVAVTPLGAGDTHCPAGGYQLGSASGTSYVCHGAAGQSVTVTPLGAGDTHCSAGGFRLDSASGVSYVCHGSDGVAGADGQSVAVTPLGAGDTHCPAGGYQLVSASGTSFVCNGADGESVTVTPLGAGDTHCPAGGYRLDSASGPAYVCNGSDTVTVTVEPQGVHCPAGGVRLDTPSGTWYVCNGVDGSGGSGGGTPVCEDQDGDGRWVGCTSYTLDRPGPDCNDGDGTIWQMLSGYADQDLDGHTSGPLRTVCAGAELPVSYRASASAVPDCNDADADVWATCATCRDADQDGQWTGCDAYTWHAGPDCDDGDALIGPHLPELPDDGRDNDCSGGDLAAAEGNGVFVAKTGVDTAAGTPAAPKLTIAAAVTAATANGTRRVYVAEGTYAESVTTGVSIFGGYSATWVRDPAAHPTLVTSGSSSTFNALGTSPVVLDGLDVVNTYSSTGAAITVNAPTTISRCDLQTGAYGVYVGSNRSATLVDTTITATGSTFIGVRLDSDTQTAILGCTLTGNAFAGYKYGVFGVADNQLLVVGSTLQLGGNVSYDSFGVYFNDERNVVRLERSTIDISTGQTTYGVRLTDLNNLLVMVQNHVISGAGVTSLGVHSYGGTGILVGNVLEDRGASIYYGVELTGPTESSSGHFEVLNNVIHADEADLAVGLRTSNSELAAMNNVVWIQNGSAVEIAATSALELYHNDLSAPPGRCLLETGSVGGFCALDIDDVNACAADGLCVGVGGNLAAAPAFVGPASGDYHLQATSALIDRGYDPIAGDGLAGLDRSTGPLGAVSVFAAGLAAVDGDGDQRPLGARWDIGIDEQ